ncbi:MAG: carboxypeptidase regulatory-like domain-containing protein [Planctomycetota bacterium]
MSRRIVATSLALLVITLAWISAEWLSEKRFRAPHSPELMPAVGSGAASPNDSTGLVAVSVRGRVFGPAGTPVRGATVTAQFGGIELGACVADADGRFDLFLRPGSLELCVGAPGLVAARVSIVVPPDRSLALTPITLQSAAAADGRIVSPEGMPIVGATVVAVPALAAPGASLEEQLRRLSSALSGPNPARRVATATSAVDGSFTLDGLEAGVGYRVVALATDRRPAERAYWVPGTALDIVLSESPWVPVHVRGPDGERPSVVTVRVLAEAGQTLLAALERRLAPEVLRTTAETREPYVPHRADFPMRLVVEAEGYLPHDTPDLRAAGSPIGITLERGSTLVVTVCDTAGSPIPDALVTAWEASGDEPRVLTGRSDAGGSCTVGPFQVDALRYLVEHPLYVVQEGPVLAAVPVTLRLEEGVALEGVVRATSGAPLAGARVTSARGPTTLPPGLSPAPIAAAITDADGAFRLPGLSRAKSPVSISAVAPGFASVSVEAELGHPLELRLAPTVPLSARVVDARGVPVSACPVIVRAATGAAARYLETDAAGNCIVADLSPGDYRLEVSPLDYPPITSELIAVHADATPPHVVVQLAAGGDLEASVVDELGRPIPGVACSFYRGEERIFSRTSDFAGLVRARGIPVGEIIVELTCAGRDSAFEVFVARAGQTRQVQWVLPARRGLVVRVSNPLGVPLERATVVGVDIRTGVRQVYAADANGQVVLRDVGVDGVDLLVEASGYGSALLRNQLPGSEPIPVVLRATGAIAGGVVDRTGAVIARYSVQVLALVGDEARPIREPQLVRSEQGEFVIDGLAEGVYDVALGAPGRGTRVERGVRVRSGQTTNLGRIDLIEGGRVMGTIFDARSGATVADAVVEVVHPEALAPPPPGTRTGALRGTRTRSDGTFTIGELRDEWVELEVRHPEFRSLRVEVRVGADGLALRLDPGGGVVGILTGAEGRPIGRAVVRLVASGVSKQAVTDNTGRFVFGGLDEGEYELTLVEIQGRDVDVVEREEGPYIQVIGVPENGISEVRWEIDLDLAP